MFVLSCPVLSSNLLHVLVLLLGVNIPVFLDEQMRLEHSVESVPYICQYLLAALYMCIHTGTDKECTRKYTNQDHGFLGESKVVGHVSSLSNLASSEPLASLTSEESRLESPECRIWAEELVRVSRLSVTLYRLQNTSAVKPGRASLPL